MMLFFASNIARRSISALEDMVSGNGVVGGAESQGSGVSGAVQHHSDSHHVDFAPAKEYAKI